MFPFTLGKVKPSERKKEDQDDSKHITNVKEVSKTQQPTASGGMSLFSGLSLHTDLKEAVKEPEKPSSHIDDLQDISFSGSFQQSGENSGAIKKAADRPTPSKFGFIKRGSTPEVKERQTSSSFTPDGAVKVKKTRKAKRFGQRNEDSSGNSESKERRASLASDNSDSSSLVSEGSDAAAQSPAVEKTIPEVDNGLIQRTEVSPSHLDRDSTPQLSDNPSDTTSQISEDDAELTVRVEALANAKSDVVSSVPETCHENPKTKKHEQNLNNELISSVNEKRSDEEIRLEIFPTQQVSNSVVSIADSNSKDPETNSSTDIGITESPISVAQLKDLNPGVNTSESNPELFVLVESKDFIDKESLKPSTNVSANNIKDVRSITDLETLDIDAREHAPDLPTTLPNARVNCRTESDIYDLELEDSDKVELTLQVLEARVNNARDDREKLTMQKTRVLEEVRQSLLTRSTLSETVQKLRSQQLDAVEQDDFDEAERLNSQLEEAMRNASEKNYRHPLMEPKVMDVVASFREMLSEHSREYSSIIEEYRVLSAEQDEKLQSVSESAKQEKVRRRNEVAKERSEVERSLNHLSLDKEYFTKNELEIENEIKERTASLNQEKADLHLEKQFVEEEITKLKEQLRLLEEKDHALAVRIQNVNGKIEKVKSEYSHRLASIEQEKCEIKDKEFTLNSNLESLKEKEQKLANEDATQLQKLTRLRTQAKTFRERIDELTRLLDTNALEPSDLSKIVDLDFFKLKTSEELTVKEKESEVLGKEVKTITSQILQNQEMAASARKELSMVEAEMIKVKRAKELAVSERKFQDAKALSASFNSLTSQANEAKACMERNSEEAARLADALDALKPKYESCQSTLHQLEKCRDEVYLSQLASATTQIKEFLTREEQTLWISPIFQLQIEICQVIGKELSSQHNLELPLELVSDEGFVLKEEQADVTTVDKAQLIRDIDELEAKLNEAVSLEDFDEADEINIKIIQLREELNKESSS